MRHSLAATLWSSRLGSGCAGGSRAPTHGSQLRLAPPKHRQADEARHAQLCVVTALVIRAKLIDLRNRWSAGSHPIR